jgi:putative effector of murein hydrolase
MAMYSDAVSSCALGCPVEVVVTIGFMAVAHPIACSIQREEGAIAKIATCAIHYGDVVKLLGRILPQAA